MPPSQTCQMSPVLLRMGSRITERVGVPLSTESKRSRRTPTACLLKMAKLTPSPLTVAPSRYGPPERTAWISVSPSERCSSASCSSLGVGLCAIVLDIIHQADLRKLNALFADTLK